MSEKAVLFFNPDCSKCKEAKSLLDGEGCSIEVIEYLSKTPDAATLKQVLSLLGISAFELIRKGEAVFQENYLDTDLDDEGWIEVMIKHPILIERPILIYGDKAVIGRPPSLVLDLLR